MRGRGVRPVNGVVGSIHAKLSSNRVWGLEFGYRCVSFSNYLSPLYYSFPGHQLKAYTDIASHGIWKVRIKTLANMFSVKTCYCLRRVLWHLKLIDFKTSLVNRIDDLPHIAVGVRLNHSECLCSMLLKCISCSYISVVGNFEHTREDSYLGSHEEVFKLDAGNLNFLEESLFFLDVVHFNHTRHHKVG